MSQATIGSALVERRRELGLEKGQAADKIGMSRTTYSSYEQDAQRPSVDVFPALAQFLDVSMEDLLTLYGATCVAAVRPMLEKVLSDHDGDVNGETNGGGPPSMIEDLDPTTPRELLDDGSDGVIDETDGDVPEPSEEGRIRGSDAHESSDVPESGTLTKTGETLGSSDPHDELIPEPERSTSQKKSPAAEPVARTAAFEPSTSIFKRELSDGTEGYPDLKKEKKKNKKKKKKK